MRYSKTFGIQFIIRQNKLDENGLTPVRARITVDGKRAEISVKKKILPSLWDHGRGKIRGNNPESRNFNRFLEHVRARVLECYQELFIEKKTITPEAIKNRFLGIEEEKHTLMELIDFHNTQNIGVLAKGTLKNYKTTERHLLEFLKTKKRKTDISLSEIDYKFITDYEHHLRTFKPKDHKRRAVANNGVMKHLIRLKKILTLAIKKDKKIHYPIISFVTRREK
ncbi:phage integrase SAM-like domain and Arm DNA-binding domain-containing protein [Echinicola sp. 20G]|uniref:phage integrase SAM-like domain and Arm DNA-binding domain-containing protein n=1 Tax=Echinicola sp. 20G TaxID=2781961 RepID=UPI0019104972|nr:phage integrase SAM-like domain and Arm DNA-binding domain-containing protein [Echinicola sp. 20G]